MPAFDFSNLAPREEPVIGPDGERYVLREASADAVIRYREMNVRARRLEDGKLVGWTGEDVASDAVLVAACLFRTDKDGQRTNLTAPVDVLRGWPNQVLERLYEWVLNNTPGLRPASSVPALEAERARIDRAIAAAKAGAVDGPKASPATGAGSS